ncbi:hypothetical protein OF83DRAFT_334856, partial [Amylostereum chailletii]
RPRSRLPRLGRHRLGTPHQAQTPPLPPRPPPRAQALPPVHVHVHPRRRRAPRAQRHRQRRGPSPRGRVRGARARVGAGRVAGRDRAGARTVRVAPSTLAHGGRVGVPLPVAAAGEDGQGPMGLPPVVDRAEQPARGPDRGRGARDRRHRHAALGLAGAHRPPARLPPVLDRRARALPALPLAPALRGRAPPPVHGGGGGGGVPAEKERAAQGVEGEGGEAAGAHAAIWAAVQRSAAGRGRVGRAVRGGARGGRRRRACARGRCDVESAVLSRFLPSPMVPPLSHAIPPLIIPSHPLISHSHRIHITQHGTASFPRILSVGSSGRSCVVGFSTLHLGARGERSIVR